MADGIGNRDEWMLEAGDHWHGFGELADGFNMLDPIKATIITPGLDMSGSFGETGIPAALVSKYLTEHGVVVEKTGLYSFFILFTIGITQGPLEHAADGLAAVQGRLRPQPAAAGASCRNSAATTGATSASACATCASRSTRPIASATWRA